MAERIGEIKSVITGPRWARIDLMIEDLAFQLDLESEVLRKTTLLREHIRFKITGEENSLLKFKEVFEKTIKNYNKL